MARRYRLPKEFGTKWIETLRTTKDPQASYTLHNTGTGGYCCLGIAGKLAGMSSQDMKGYGSLSESIVGNFEVPKELVGSTWLAETCASMNDSKGKTFSEIADWLEENVELY